MCCDLWHRDSGHITQRFRDIANRLVREKFQLQTFSDAQEPFALDDRQPQRGYRVRFFGASTQRRLGLGI